MDIILFVTLCNYQDNCIFQYRKYLNKLALRQSKFEIFTTAVLCLEVYFSPELGGKSLNEGNSFRFLSTFRNQITNLLKSLKTSSARLVPVPVPEDSVTVVLVVDPEVCSFRLHD